MSLVLGIRFGRSMGRRSSAALGHDEPSPRCDDASVPPTCGDSPAGAVDQPDPVRRCQRAADLWRFTGRGRRPARSGATMPACRRQLVDKGSWQPSRGMSDGRLVVGAQLVDKGSWQPSRGMSDGRLVVGAQLVDKGSWQPRGLDRQLAVRPDPCRAWPGTAKPEVWTGNLPSGPTRAALGQVQPSPRSGPATCRPAHPAGRRRSPRCNHVWQGAAGGRYILPADDVRHAAITCGRARLAGDTSCRPTTFATPVAVWDDEDLTRPPWA